MYLFGFFDIAWLNFDNLSAIIFLIIMLFLIVRYKQKLTFQVMLKIINIPLIYAVLWKTKFGLKFMDKIADKYRELVKLIGYCFVGFGFIGMIFISFNILYLLFQLFVSPRTAAQGVAPVLPLTNIPGLGYLSFWHFLITIFITVLVHEFAHGIVARAHKIPVKASGLGVFSLILPLFPLAFVEPEEKKLEKSPDIVQYSIFSAGPMTNIILYLVVVLLFSFVVIPLESNITHPVGISFNGLMDNYSAQEAGMRPGTIINSYNGEQVLTYQNFTSLAGDIRPDQQITLGTDNGTFTIVTKPSPDDPEKGYIGILDIRNERRINDKYSSFGTAFFWIKDLIRWLFMINLLVGLMNLLPLMVTDGGRMLKTAFEKIFKDSKKADKLWMFIGFLFIFTLISALVVRYTLPLFDSIIG
jgi:membrane-associated protease RseP (regulator of RpoE activity)